jgi:hypothetical protein|tara:strand:- start:63 stop:827 length:765 start_codon:yes stop_codon:yes gene_type:complete
MVNINSVYQKVLALANKEQRGYITPQEFNLFADKAQLEIYENYFHKIKMSDVKPKNQMNYADELEMLEEKLHAFHVDEFVNYDTTNDNLPLPKVNGDVNVYKLIGITRSGEKVTQVNKSQVAYTEKHPLLKSNKKRSVFVREDSGVVSIHPAPTESDYNFNTVTQSNTIPNDTERFEVSFYKKPIPPNWTYTVVQQKALFNVTSPSLQHFELHFSEEENLVYKILMLAGLMIKQPDVQQSAAAGIEMNKREQNS